MEDFELKYVNGRTHDNEYTNPQLKKLNEYFEKTPKEVQERHFHEIMCEMYNIDPDDPKSKRKVKRCLRWSWFKCSVWPHIRNVVCVFCMIWLFIHAGWGVAMDYPVWLTIFYIAGGLGWFFIFLRNILEIN